ncbi:hypothetical protein NST81_01770 [Bacillus sp. FSL W8-0223]|uniref:hypothetical protein n=1 Tax=Bacillus sp. FSL W8-0223 TaxID=2954595 RepID=UPI0030F97FB0
MCDLCNGSRRVIDDTGFGYVIQTCPNCGPMSEKEFQEYHKLIRERIAAAEEKLSMSERGIADVS